MRNIFSSKRSSKARKNVKNLSKGETYSSRLLWNTDGEWLDRWFYYSNGVLAGYRDASSTKPAEVELHLRDCRLSAINMNNTISKRLHLFQLETKDGRTHLFIAWNEDQFESWLECLTFATVISEVTYELQSRSQKTSIDNGEDGHIVPYEDSPISEVEQQKTTSSSSDTSVHGRVDSIDSGNDGDESGLECSLSSDKKLLETRKKLEKERKFRGIRSSSFNENVQHEADSTDQKDFGESIPVCMKLELTRQISRESTSTENDLRSPEPQHPEPSFYENNKKKRNSFIKKKFTFFDSKSRKDEHAGTKNHQQKTPSPSVSPKQSVVNKGDQNLRLKRPDSLDISSLENLSVWEGFEQYKTMESEDDISDSYSVPSLIDEKIREEQEDCLRAETFLRKRRNSLTLERSQIFNKLQTLRETSPTLMENNNVQDAQTSKMGSTFPQENIKMLSRRIEDIDAELGGIEKRLHRGIDVVDKGNRNKNNKHKKTSKTQIMSKIKMNAKQRWFDNNNSLSAADSLSSVASKESRETATPNKEGVRFAPNMNTSVSTQSKPELYSSKSTEGILNEPHFNGLEELLITTQRLESSSSTCSQGTEEFTSNGIWRSKSLGAMELLRTHPKTPDVSENGTNPETIIEDFEKFSEMLSSQMKTRNENNNTQPIGV